MESEQEQEIRKKISALQSLLPGAASVPKSPPRKRRAEPNELVPATPSPHKKRKVHVDQPRQPQASSSRVKSKQPQPRDVVPIQPSTVLSRLSDINKRQPHEDLPESSNEALKRSSGFAERPAELSETPSVQHGAARDDRLALIEELEPGPYDHLPPIGDPLFDDFEPNSGIRLSSRAIAHDDLQNYLTGRYYVSPSRLYSCIRLLPGNQAYDVPVPGDWITIAVVAERGPVKYSRAPVTIPKLDGNSADAKSKSKKKKQDDETSKPSGKKYVNVKLVDFGARSAKSSSSVATIRGDALLTLLLFESDGYDLVTYDEDGRGGRKPKPRKVYKGGSRGAFESMSKLKEGDVIALLNPRVLKPFQKSSDRPHPSTNVLAVTPESASSIEILGTAKDLGLCSVVKRDGKRCNAWCDKRVSEVCEYHVQTAVESRRASRPEFSMSTGGLSRTAEKTKKTDYDPRKKWGLAPQEQSSLAGGSTYVVSGHVVAPSQMHVSETVGRDAQARAQRKGKDADKELKSLLDRDKDGMKAVIKARAVGKQLIQEKADMDGKGKKKKKGGEEVESVEEEDDEEDRPKKSAYSVGMIKDLGFDPTLRPGQQRKNTTAMQEKLDLLSGKQQNRKGIALGRRPGTKIMSGVVVPLSSDAMDTHNGMIDLDEF